MRGLDGKRVLVTGAASGIGLATARRLTDEGAVVTGLDRADAADGFPGTFRAADITDVDAVDAVVAEMASAGRVDAVVHAAGVAGGGAVHALDPDAWREVIDINLTGTFLVCRRALAAMLDQPRVDGERGSIVTLASIEGIEGTAGGSSYNAAKGGVVILTKNIAIDYGRRGIRANAICPGFVETPLTDFIFHMEGMEEVGQGIIDAHKLGRLGQPDEIASVAAFLVSRDASFLSGQAVVVDGGYTAGRDHGVVALLGLGPDA